jgi:hypothetical protein
LSRNNKLLFEADKKIEKMINLKNDKNLILQTQGEKIDRRKKSEKESIFLNKNQCEIKKISTEEENSFPSQIKSSNLNKDLLLNFKKHFAKILSRTFKTYLFRKRVNNFLNRIKGSNKFLTIFSKYKIRDLSNKLLEKIIKIQKYIKLKTYKINLFRLYINSKQVVDFRMKKLYQFFKKQIKIKEIIRSCYKLKLKKLKENIFNKSKKKILSKFKELTSSAIAKKYYENKIKIKLLVNLFLN